VADRNRAGGGVAPPGGCVASRRRSARLREEALERFGPADALAVTNTWGTVASPVIAATARERLACGSTISA
jgi:hypothetical protein